MRNAVGFLSITATVCSPDSSRAASSEPTRPQPMITTCTRHLPVETTRVIVAGLDALFAPGGAAVPERLPDRHLQIARQVLDGGDRRQGDVMARNSLVSSPLRRS